MRFLNWISLPLSRPTFHESRVVFVLSSFPNLQGLLHIKLWRTLLIFNKKFDRRCNNTFSLGSFSYFSLIFLQNWAASLLQDSWFSLWGIYRLNLVLMQENCFFVLRHGSDTTSAPVHTPRSRFQTGACGGWPQKVCIPNNLIKLDHLPLYLLWSL